MNLPKVKMLQVSKCLIGLAVMMLQSCDVADNRRDMLCGNWESVAIVSGVMNCLASGVITTRTSAPAVLNKRQSTAAL